MRSGQNTILYGVLRILARGGGYTATELAGMLDKDDCHVRYTIRALRREGLIEVGQRRGRNGGKPIWLIRPSPSSASRGHSGQRPSPDPSYPQLPY